jgi:hypothetical protein
MLHGGRVITLTRLTNVHWLTRLGKHLIKLIHTWGEWQSDHAWESNKKQHSLKRMQMCIRNSIKLTSQVVGSNFSWLHTVLNIMKSNLVWIIKKWLWGKLLLYSCCFP